MDFRHMRAERHVLGEVGAEVEWLAQQLTAGVSVGLLDTTSIVLCLKTAGAVLPLFGVLRPTKGCLL
jgi:hypothetical protein